MRVRKFNLAFLVLSLMAAPSVFAVNGSKSNTFQTMSSKAAEVVALLTKEQLKEATYKYDSEEKAQWRYFPSSKLPTIFPNHKGLQISKLAVSQQEKVMELVKTAMSEQGYETVKIVRTQDSDPAIKRKPQERAFFKYGKENYFISFFGLPTDRKWMMRFEGHHVSLNVSVEDGKVVSAAPFFLGINPADYVYEGRTIETHDNIVASVKELNSTLTDLQIATAESSLKELPKDLIYTPALVKGTIRLPKREELPLGLSYKQMSVGQQKAIMNIVANFTSNLNETNKAVILEKINQYGLENLEYIFKGQLDLDGFYYFRIQGPSFVLEFETVDGSAKHYHVALQELK